VTDQVRQLQEALDEARFHNRVLTWIAAALLLGLLASLVYFR
jgi:hypothetical protein